MQATLSRLFAPRASTLFGWGLGVCALALALTGPVRAQTIYHCVSNGHTTLTDQPCDGKPIPRAASSSAPAGPLATSVGTWHGAALIDLTVDGKPLAPSPLKSDLEFTIGPDGELTGSLKDLGCDLRGKIAEAYNPGEDSLVVKLAHCRQNNLNLDYTGIMKRSVVGQPARFALTGLSGYVTGKSPTGSSLHAEVNRASALKTGPGN